MFLTPTNNFTAQCDICFQRLHFHYTTMQETLQIYVSLQCYIVAPVLQSGKVWPSCHTAVFSPTQTFKGKVFKAFAHGSTALTLLSLDRIIGSVLREGKSFTCTYTCLQKKKKKIFGRQVSQTELVWPATESQTA